MTWAAVAIGGGAVLNYAGGQQAANAAGSAAGAQQGMAAQTRGQILNYSNTQGQNVINSAGASPQELNTLGQSYTAALQGVQQQQKLMSSIDPALMAASKQALTILHGGQASVNQPMMNLRNSQRSQLMNQLTAQYGPGAASSSIGQRALQQFDMQTDSMFQQNQQQSLQQMMGLAGNGGQQSQQAMSGAIGSLNQVGQGYSNIQNRITNANTNVLNSTLGAMSGTNQQMINSAGAGSVESGLQGQGLAGMGNQIMGNGGTLAKAFGAWGKKDPTTPDLGGGYQLGGNNATLGGAGGNPMIAIPGGMSNTMVG